MFNENYLDKLIEIEEMISNNSFEDILNCLPLINQQIPFLVENLIYLFQIRPKINGEYVNLINKINKIIINKEFFKHLLLVLSFENCPILLIKLVENHFFDFNYLNQNLKTTNNYLSIYFGG